MNNCKLSKKEFEELFIKPLEDVFGYKVFWSGNESKSAGLKTVSGNYTGWSYTSRKDAPIVLRFSSNQLHLFKALIHEYAHSHLHKIGSKGEKLTHHIKEIEAETVAKKVMELLNVPYTEHWYIPYHQNKCKDNDFCNYNYDDRNIIMQKMSEDIANIFSSKVNTIKSLVSENNLKQTSYKYKVVCSCCNKEWFYKRKCKIIIENAKGYWCTICGKTKSFDKLTVEKI